MPFSPRTRGCSFSITKTDFEALVFPAHAGMFPKKSPRVIQKICFPRARGDVPYRAAGTGWVERFSPRTRGCSEADKAACGVVDVFPAHAGMFLKAEASAIEFLRFPRARGDVPSIHHRSNRFIWFSPRTRGCSHDVVWSVPHSSVFPAHAGMFPAIGYAQTALRSFPRARGDVPLRKTTPRCKCTFSPRTRGCS